MKYNKILLVIITAFILFGCNDVKFDEYFEEINNTKNYPALSTEQSNYITDLCLIYNGRPNNKITYNKESLKPYIYYTDGNGKANFLFDGFLLLEIVGSNGKTMESNPEMTNMKEWNWYLDQQFKEDVALSAMDQVLDSLAKTGITPKRKRKIVIGIPTPHQSDKVFGTVEGKVLKMDNIADRVSAAKWFIDDALRRYEQKGFKHLDLAGFYYNNESAKEDGDSIIPLVATYLKTKSMTFYWIPYFGGPGAKDWKKLGFDIAYQQPNYFFKKSTVANMPATRVNDAAHYASKYGMALEFEFDDNITDTLYQRKFNEYCDGFKKEQVFEKSPIAYYEGGGTWFRMYKSENDTIQALYRKLSTIIIERQQKADSFK